MAIQLPTVSSKAAEKMVTEFDECRKFVINKLTVKNTSSAIVDEVNNAFVAFFSHRFESKKGGKRKADPNAVKKEPNEYNKFIGEAIKRVRAQEPSITFQEAMVKAAAEWNEHKKTLPISEKPKKKTSNEKKKDDPSTSAVQQDENVIPVQSSESSVEDNSVIASPNHNSPAKMPKKAVSKPKNTNKDDN